MDGVKASWARRQVSSLAITWSPSEHQELLTPHCPPSSAVCRRRGLHFAFGIWLCTAQPFCCSHAMAPCHMLLPAPHTSPCLLLTPLPPFIFFLMTPAIAVSEML